MVWLFMEDEWFMGKQKLVPDALNENEISTNMTNQ